MGGIIVHVTDDDILNGQPRDCGSCPVALAIGRVTQRYAEVTLECGEAFVRLDEDDETRTALPSFVYGKAIAFDETGEMDPFTFTVTF